MTQEIKHLIMEVWDGPYQDGKYSFTLFWKSEYPNEKGSHQRAQCFRANPRNHLVPGMKVVDTRKQKGNERWLRGKK